MDNVNEIDQTALNKYFGLTGGNTGAGTDASGSKTMEVKGGQEIEYTYTRGGVKVTGTINYANQTTTWAVTGMGAAQGGNTNRQQAIAEGLKVDVGNISFT